MMLVEKGCRVALHVSGEGTVSVGWSLGLLFDHRGGDYPQSMLNLVSPYELKESKVEISSSPCVHLSPHRPLFLLLKF